MQHPERELLTVDRVVKAYARGSYCNAAYSKAKHAKAAAAAASNNLRFGNAKSDFYLNKSG